MDFRAIKLKLASPEDILKWSYGEVIKPETINYRTQRPEKDGLFSERIFGPTKDWECYCGKYRRIRYKGVTCDKCGVEVTRAIVRRERMAHISLAAPVAHIWYFKNVPSKIGVLLDVPLGKLEKVIYYASYIVTGVNEANKKRVLGELENEFDLRKKTARKEGVKTDELRQGMSAAKKELGNLEVGQILSDNEYFNLSKRFADVFDAATGAEALQRILAGLELKPLIKQLEKDLETIKDPMKEKLLLRRLKLATSMHRSGIKPEWMVMTVLPVLPPDLRPMVALDGGRYATSDLNDLYRRVINRNNRLKKLMELHAPDVIVVNEKRMLQEAVDALIDNSARFGVQQLSSQRRPLRSLADMLKGKQGRFRQNLLGKRVDYSARSVIVIGPDLKLGQCGLPKKMALELFKPFVINKVIERGLAYNIRNANRLIDQAPSEIWAILEEVITDRKVLLNRAPTLHRLGVQAFQPILIEDLAIRIPPMVCPAFNADFDGDQMAVHLPLGQKAQKEASEIMLASLNLLKPATGDPITVPTQDIVLGCYYLTGWKEDAIGAGKIFSTNEEAMMAYHHGYIAINAPIKIGSPKAESVTIGRVIFNQTLPTDFGFVNKVMNKKEMSKIVAEVIHRYGVEKASVYLDAIKKVGFDFATISGISWGMDDLIAPPQKAGMIAKAEDQVAIVRDQYQQGLLTDHERRARIIMVWDKVKSEIAKLVPTILRKDSSVYQIIDSGARGTWAQPVQMAGMKGLVANPKGETIELPIRSSYKEGLSVLEYFISTHGARKGSTDTALKTASAGYLTRRLVDVAQDLVIKEENCGTKEGILINRAEGLLFGSTLATRLFSRTVLEDVKVDGKVVVKAGEIVDRATAEVINKSDIEQLKIKSPITCKTLYGVCTSCYGYDLGNNKPIKIGEAVGIVAAQSIGEPGTQLTMRTFHIGGIAGSDITHGLPRVEEVFEARPPKGRAFLAEEDGVVASIEDRGLSKVINVTQGKKENKEYVISRMVDVFVKVGEEVKKGQQLCEGNLDLKELFSLRGSEAAQNYVINEVQRIYGSEGASISNKHLEVIVRQMFSRVKIKESGDSNFVVGDVIEKSRFLEINRGLKKVSKTPAKAVQLLMGITKVALSTESFLSSASFQETARVLIGASLEGKEDTLRGLKENVIIGRLIPVGTGLAARLADGTLPEQEVASGDE